MRKSKYWETMGLDALSPRQVVEIVIPKYPGLEADKKMVKTWNDGKLPKGTRLLVRVAAYVCKEEMLPDPHRVKTT